MFQYEFHSSHLEKHIKFHIIWFVQLSLRPVNLTVIRNNATREQCSQIPKNLAKSQKVYGSFWISSPRGFWGRWLPFRNQIYKIPRWRSQRKSSNCSKIFYLGIFGVAHYEFDIEIWKFQDGEFKTARAHMKIIVECWSETILLCVLGVTNYRYLIRLTKF